MSSFSDESLVESLCLIHERLKRLESQTTPSLGVGLEHHPAWQVNPRTNKQWRFRVELVDDLRKWVLERLDPNSKVYRNINKKLTPEGREQKAEQYVIEHLALGKMIHPLEPVDPLFTQEDYDDESMREQLLDGLYPEFRAEVREKLHKVLDFDTASAPPVKWSWIEGELRKRKYKTHRLQELQDGLSKAKGAQCKPLGTASPEITEKMIGLVLRYMCMGAFDSNFHGSVSQSWAQELPGFVECFASPFNHKFRTYYTMFEQDRDFGSSGNFFVMLGHRGGVLPPGRYEMNPPWMNAMYERLQEVMECTMDAGVDVLVVIMGPKWKDTKWIPGLTRIMEEAPEAYLKHSRHIVDKVSYVQDMTKVKFDFDTVAWIFSKRPVPEQVNNLFRKR